MAAKLSPSAQLKLDALTEARRKWDRVHSRVEQYGSTAVGENALLGQISRAAADVSQVLLNQGYGTMADTAGQLGMLAKRGTGKQTKLRTMREFIVSVRQALDRAEKMVLEEDRTEEGQAEGNLDA